VTALTEAALQVFSVLLAAKAETHDPAFIDGGDVERLSLAALKIAEVFLDVAAEREQG
jgi:hypothetical protein